MTYRLGKRSRRVLRGVHHDLVILVATAIVDSPIDFTVLEGLRTEERQRQLVSSGASKTMNSRHLTGHAVDVAPWFNGAVSWHGPHFDFLAEHMKSTAKRLGIGVEWGGDWRTFVDKPHWQLPRSVK